VTAASAGGLLDTSFIVRYLTGAPPHLARAAREVIDSEESLGVTDVAIVETGYVLVHSYAMPREAVVDALVTFIERRNIVCVGTAKEFMVLALLMCRPSGRVSFADAAMWAAARSQGIEGVYTFDDRFPSDGLALLRSRGARG
jgi:predicted nucleic acid-binding protein